MGSTYLLIIFVVFSNQIGLRMNGELRSPSTCTATTEKKSTKKILWSRRSHHSIGVQNFQLVLTLNNG